MQRFLVGIIGIAVVVFGFVTFINAQDDVALSDLLPTETATATAPAGPTVPDAPASPAPAPPTAPEASAPAGDIDSIRVTPVSRIPDYDRDLFGDWVDTDGNGCRTRDDILARDMSQVTTKDGCKVLTGVLADPYSGKNVPFTFGPQTSQDVQIDHIVSLSAAWKAGAHGWTEETRVQFANDPANLLAVDGPTNSAKSDKGPARWMPSGAGNASFDCAYATSYTDVLVKYDLTAPAEDIAALRAALATC